MRVCLMKSEVLITEFINLLDDHRENYLFSTNAFGATNYKFDIVGKILQSQLVDC
jgi:hypothetical protein